MLCLQSDFGLRQWVISKIVLACGRLWTPIPGLERGILQSKACCCEWRHAAFLHMFLVKEGWGCLSVRQLEMLQRNLQGGGKTCVFPSEKTGAKYSCKMKSKDLCLELSYCLSGTQD